jgi:hypothetical protein
VTPSKRVHVDDLPAHFAHAKGRGATIVDEIHPYPGSPVYVAGDLEGNRWTFAQARPTMRRPRPPTSRADLCTAARGPPTIRPAVAGSADG